jgi:hypothetical protein
MPPNDVSSVLPVARSQLLVDKRKKEKKWNIKTQNQ